MSGGDDGSRHATAIDLPVERFLGAGTDRAIAMRVAYAGIIEGAESVFEAIENAIANGTELPDDDSEPPVIFLHRMYGVDPALATAPRRWPREGIARAPSTWIA